MTTAWAFRRNRCRTSSSGSIVWTRRARDRWAARGWDCQLSKRSSRLTAVRSGWKASKAKDAASSSSYLLQVNRPIYYMSVDQNFPKEDIKKEGDIKFEEGGH